MQSIIHDIIVMMTTLLRTDVMLVGINTIPLLIHA